MKKVVIALALAASAAGAVYLIRPPYRAFKISSQVLGEKRNLIPVIEQRAGRLEGQIMKRIKGSI